MEPRPRRRLDAALAVVLLRREHGVLALGPLALLRRWRGLRNAARPCAALSSFVEAVARGQPCLLLVWLCCTHIS
jgi:hypothetical protein